MDGEAEWYRNVEVEFVKGRSPTLTVYHDNVPHGEPKDLSRLGSRDEIHQLFLDLGFERKSPAEIAEIEDRYYAETKQQRERKWERSEYLRQRSLDIEEFKSNVLLVPMEGKSAKVPSDRLLVKQYENIFGRKYLSMEDRGTKASVFLQNLNRRREQQGSL